MKPVTYCHVRPYFGDYALLCSFAVIATLFLVPGYLGWQLWQVSRKISFHIYRWTKYVYARIEIR